MLKKFVVLLVGVLMLYVNPVSASLFGCSADRQRCLNQCAEKNRVGAFSGIKATSCKARCLLSECLFYPRKEKKSAHPSDRLRGFAI
ncbi:putative integral membrane protein [Theileria parva strain Muguga]|uniref:Uncharacterized protein n=1 Tax=Theileria parva TaxID=5875 RepID=Q4N1Z2_THEPA|nr:putative integral membrane protein [Theileria parva strain Muguga]EAN31937.1 putative integral membrane protein [Theileria parva strain Muguga]|eukprot:XP_764220.1 hypothetical protein [Theileria parva strain Muguga]